MSTPSYNRLKQFAQHNPHSPYLFSPYAKLAKEAGLAASTISRLRRGQVASPRFATICKLAEFFERHYERSFDPREIFYPGGEFQSKITFSGGTLIDRRPTEQELAVQTARNYTDDLDRL